MKCSLEMLNSFKTNYLNFITLRKRNILNILWILQCQLFFTKMATKWAKINLQTSFRPIWNPENQGYKIGYEKSYQEQQ